MAAPKETIVRTVHGGVRLRPLTADDAPAAIDTVFARLSPHSRHLRFHSPVPRLTPALRSALADLDGHRRVALVAEAGDGPVGIARFAATGGGAAEAAIAVVDPWQRRGVGRGLLTALAGLAADLGLRRLTGSVLPENAGMLALAARLAPGARPVRDGECVRVSVPVGEAAWTVTDEDVLADLLAR